MEWGDYRDDVVRYLLKDTVDPYQWTDEELLGYANWGIADLCRTAPTLKSYSLTGAGPTYTLPTDFDTLRSITIVNSTGGTTHFLAQLNPLEDEDWDFDTPDTGSSPWGYILDWPDEDEVYVSRLLDTGDALTLYYWGLRDEMALDTDELPFSRHRWMYQALAYYIGYVAHIRQSVGRAGLEQWSQRPDLPVGNPLSAEAREFLTAYNRLCSLYLRRD